MSDNESELPDPCPAAPWPFVAVRWHDSAAAAETWCGEEDAPSTIEIITRGWRISNTRRQIKLVGSYYKSEGKWMYGEIIAIPRIAIIEERELRICLCISGCTCTGQS